MSYTFNTKLENLKQITMFVQTIYVLRKLKFLQSETIVDIVYCQILKQILSLFYRFTKALNATKIVEMSIRIITNEFQQFSNKRNRTIIEQGDTVFCPTNETEPLSNRVTSFFILHPEFW